MAQLVAAVAAAAVLLVDRRGPAGFAAPGTASPPTATATHSPGGYGLGAALLTEAVLTAFFALVILGATDRRAPRGIGALAIGLALTVIHLVSIPVTNTSVNPARSTGPALFAGGAALSSCGCSGSRPSSAGSSPASATAM